MFKGKTALVTGATSGIGRATIEKFAKDGANILFNGFKYKEEIKDIENSIISKYNVECIYRPTNMNVTTEVEELAEFGLKKFGKVDILVNNAGMNHFGKIWDFPIDKFQEIFNVNLVSAFILMKKLTPEMIKNKWGRIINVSSCTTIKAIPTMGPYVSTKHALNGLTKAYAIEVGELGITANCILPGSTDSAIFQMEIESVSQKSGLTKDQVLKNCLSRHVTKNLIQPEEIADMIALLARDESKNITGACISVDAGYGI